MLILISAILINAQDLTQTFINQNWSAINGLPEQVDWSASVVDAQRNLYITGNKATLNEGTNLTLTKYNRSGVLVWEEEYNNSSDGNDYGTALVIDNSGDIVVVGTSYNLANNYDYTILKYDSDGTLLWSEHFDGTAGGHDIASSVTIDASDNIYLTGGSEGTTTLVDYCTLKYSSSGNFQWEARYDHQNMYDGAVSILTRGSLIIVTGGSGNDWTNGEIATVGYDFNGNEVAVRREESAETGYDQPYDLKTDNAGNIYVTGKVASTSDGFNIKTIKLDEDLDVIWVNEFDGHGLDDEGRSIALDGLGNVYITGTTTKPGGGSNIITIKYDIQGNQEWAKQQHTVPTHFNARGVRIAYNDGMLVVCGEREREQGSQVSTIGYDTDGKWLFLKDFEYEANSDHAAHSLSLIDNTIYIHGILNINGNDKYFALKYHYHHKESYFVSSEESFGRVGKELVIDFDPNVMNLDVVDHDHFMFSALRRFINEPALNCLRDKTKIDFSKQIATKVFPECHSWDTLSTSRLGNPVPIPKFWSTLLVELPPGANDTLILDSILTCTQYVRGAYFNELGEYADCTPNDPNYQAENQAGLAPTLLTPNAHVNIEEAWCFASGSSEIKVGVLDSGIRHNHEDLHDEPGSESYEGSDVAGGYNLVIQLSTPPVAIQDVGPPEYFHGTNVAGIISARRNNGIGVAGIAGRNDDQQGVQLFDLRVGNVQLGPQTVWARAMYLAATDEDQVGPEEFPTDVNSGLGLHVINISLTGGELPFRKAAEYCFRNDVVIVAASGNWTESSPYDIDYPLYPASFRDEWVLKIGANDNTGNRAESFSVYDNDLDFIAPGVNDIYQSLPHDDISGYTPTEVNTENWMYPGTSFAAPHVVGIAALMKSYVDVHPEAPNALSAEDVEHLMQTNVNNDPHYYDVIITGVGYDVETGYGRPNAGKILEKLQLPCYKVRHFAGSVQANIAWVNDGTTTVNVTTSQTALSSNLPFGFPTADYTANRYKVSLTLPHDLEGDEVINFWKRDAASNLASITNELPGEGVNVSVESFSETSATLSGYIYHIVDGGNEYWWPIEPTDEAVFAYSVYTYNPEAEPCLTTSINTEEPVRANIYPNPAFNQIYITWSEWKDRSTLQIFSVTGTQVSQHIISGKSGIVNVSHLSSGMYFFVLRSDDELKTFKIVKR